MTLLSSFLILVIWISFTDSRLLGCTVNGQQGNGTERGTCEQDFLCHSDGSCQEICRDRGSRGNGTSRGTCDEGETCFSDGVCRRKCKTQGGPDHNKECLLPFIFYHYQLNIYSNHSKCALDYVGKPWCPTKLDQYGKFLARLPATYPDPKPINKNWGYCGDDCEIVDLPAGKEFVRFNGTTCSKEHQYGNFDNFTEAKLACAFDQDCIAFHAIQSGCVKYRQECKKYHMPNLNVSQDDDFRLCKKNSKLRNEITTIHEYSLVTKGDSWRCQRADLYKRAEDCFHDAYVKSNELVCIDKIPKDEHERCPLCGSENFSNGDDSFRFNCSSKWQFETQENPRADCKGYNTSANRKIEDICKATCNKCDSLESFGYDMFFETSTEKYSSTRMENNRTDYEAESTTIVSEDNKNETTDDEDGNAQQTVPLATISTKTTEGKKDKISSTKPTIAKTASNVDSLHPFGNIARFLFFQIMSLKLISW